MDYDQDTGEVLNERAALPAMNESRPQNLIFASADCGEVFGALCAAQGAMPAPKRTKTAKVKGRTKDGVDYEYSYAYAPLEEIINSIREPMKNAGLAYRQFLAQRNGVHVMRTVVAHQSGQWLGCDYPIFWDETRGMQGFASGVTYARRYGLMLALGIAAEDDDDANLADGQPATIAEKRGGRAAPANARGHSGSQNQQQATQPPPGAPASAPNGHDAGDQTPKRKQALADWRAMKAAIETAASVAIVETILRGQDFDALKERIAEIEGADNAIGAMNRLAAFAEKRIAELGGPSTQGFAP